MSYIRHNVEVKHWKGMSQLRMVTLVPWWREQRHCFPYAITLIWFWVGWDSYCFSTPQNRMSEQMLLGLGIDSDVPIRFRLASSQFDSILDTFITFSEYSFKTKAIDISKTMNSKHPFTNGELIKRYWEPQACILNLFFFCIGYFLKQ